MRNQAANDNQVTTKPYLDQFHQEIERSRKDLGLSFYIQEVDLVKDQQDNTFNDNKAINTNSNTVNREPVSDSEVSSKKYVYDLIGEGTTVRFNQTLQNYLKSICWK